MNKWEKASNLIKCKKQVNGSIYLKSYIIEIRTHCKLEKSDTKRALLTRFYKISIHII